MCATMIMVKLTSSHNPLLQVQPVSKQQSSYTSQKDYLYNDMQSDRLVSRLARSLKDTLVNSTPGFRGTTASLAENSFLDSKDSEVSDEKKQMVEAIANAEQLGYQSALEPQQYMHLDSQSKHYPQQQQDNVVVVAQQQTLGSLQPLVLVQPHQNIIVAQKMQTNVQQKELTKSQTVEMQPVVDAALQIYPKPHQVMQQRKPHRHKIR